MKSYLERDFKSHYKVGRAVAVDSADSAEMAMSTFLKTTAIIKNISVENWYENFTFEQRIYPELFEIL